MSVMKNSNKLSANWLIAYTVSINKHKIDPCDIPKKTEKNQIRRCIFTLSHFFWDSCFIYYIGIKV